MIKKLIYFVQTLCIVAWIAVLALSFRWSILEIYMIPQQGMMPTLFAGDYVMVNKLSYGLKLPFSSYYISQWNSPQRGDVIVFNSPFNSHSLSIRRVIGVPHDIIVFKNGDLYINDKKIIKQIPSERKQDFSWVQDSDFSAGGITEDKSHYAHWQETLSHSTYSILLQKQKIGYVIFGPYRIPAHHYFVMGDHRDRSQDSRTWPSKLQKATGKVTFFGLPGQKNVVIAKGTLLKTQNTKWPQYFETKKKVILDKSFVTVNVQAKEAGLAGNILAGELSLIENKKYSQILSVRNDQNFTGGKDAHLVFKLDVLGRVSRVLWSCKNNIFTFFCNPTNIRWNRMFFPVYHKGLIKKGYPL